MRSWQVVRGGVLVICAWGVAYATRAETNLPLSCKTQSNPCPVSDYQYVPGRDGLLMITPENTWRPWEAIPANGAVRVCPQDILTGTTSCPVGRVTITKAEAATAVVTPVPTDPTATFAVKVTWTPPTKNADGSALADTDIAGYGISWKRDGDTEYRVVNVGRVTEYTLLVPKAQVCVHLHTIAVGNNSMPTTDICIEPKVSMPGAPANVTVTFGEPR